MKKNLIYWVAFMLMGLFAACSQEETPDALNGKGQRVSISAQLPVEFSKTRALPEANGHQLRCILEVWSQEETPALLYRTEKPGSPATDGMLSFEFSLDAGTYDCLMWADFIANDAQLTDGRYADKYYTTQNLRSVTLKDASSLYNTDACDAFFGSIVLEKNDLQEVQSFSTTLKRPFAKLIVSEKKKANFEQCKTVSVKHNVPRSFNVTDGTVSTEFTAAVLTDALLLGAGDTDLRLFSCYVLADNEEDALKEINLSFKNAAGEELRTTAIPAGVAIQRNHCTKASGHLIAESTVNTEIEVGVGSDWGSDITEGITPSDPAPGVEEVKAGSFYYADGTWSEVLDESKTCVGIVFAAGTGNGDNVTAYGNKLKEIKGYVMALNNTAKLNLYPGAAIPEPGSLATDAEDVFLGFSYTSLMTSRSDYATEGNFAILKSMKENFADINGTSGWFIPSIKQMDIILATYYDTEANGFNAALSTLIEKGKANSFEVAHSSNKTGYITSSINADGRVKRINLDNVSHEFLKASAKTSDSGFVRPVFTF